MVVKTSCRRRRLSRGGHRQGAPLCCSHLTVYQLTLHDLRLQSTRIASTRRPAVTLRAATGLLPQPIGQIARSLRSSARGVCDLPTATTITAGCHSYASCTASRCISSPFVDAQDCGPCTLRRWGRRSACRARTASSWAASLPWNLTTRCGHSLLVV